ncbi:Pyruvate dehydrogenase, partial [Pseudomonas syringae pv. maculicola]
MNRCVFER